MKRNDRKGLRYWFQNCKFQKKIIITYLMVALIPMTFWFAFSSREMDKVLKERAQLTLNGNVKSMGEQLSKKLEKTEYTLQSFAFDRRITEIMGKDFTSEYEKYSQVHNMLDSYLDAVSLLNRDVKNINIYSDGSLQGARKNFKSMEELKEKPIYEKIENSFDPVWDISEKKASVYQKMYNIDDIRFCGVVEFQIKYGDNSVLNNMEYQDTDWIFLEDATGKILHEQGKKPENTESWMKSSVELSPWGFKLTALRDSKSALLQMNDAFYSLLIWLVIVGLLLLAVIWLFSREMVRRLVSLNEQVKEIVPSNFKKDISSQFRDEVGAIANTIGLMIKETRIMIRENYERKLAQKDAEFRALQAQINPHFLYNTLSMMRWKALRNHDTELAGLISSLAVFYRTTLNQGESITTVEKELENVKAYLEIQTAIHEGRFEVRYEIEEGMEEYEMPALILQPLVENAVEHGILECKRKDSGHLVIRAKSTAEELFLEVEDDGEGMTEEQVEEILVHQKKGYGVKNVNDRLQLFFDEDYGLNFYPNEPYGTMAVVHMPKYISI